MYNNGNDSNNEYVTYDTFIDMLSAYQEHIIVTNNPTGVSTGQSSSLTPSSLVIVDELKGFNYLDCKSLSLTSNNPLTEPSNVSAQEFRGKIVGTGNLTSLNLSTGATDGYVLTSDALGNGTWQASTSSTASTISITSSNTSTLQYIPFVTNAGTNKTVKIDDTTTPLTYLPSTGELTAVTFTGALNGNATTATEATNAGTVTVGTNDDPTTKYLMFCNTVGNKQPKIDDTTTPLSYVPSTSTLTASVFSGSLSGNATTATTASDANAIDITSSNTATLQYIPFVTNAGTNKTVKIDDTTGPLTYLPSTGELSAITFTGALNGNASTATTATTANQVMCESINANASYPIVMSSTTGTGEKSLLIDDTTTPLTYNPSTGKLSTNAIQIGTSATSGYVLTADASGNGTWQASSGGGTNATTISLTSDNTSGTYYLPFSKTTTSTNNALYIDNATGPLSYNPSTSTLTATTFSGTATNASNVVITSDNTSGTYYVPFSKTTAGTNPLYIDDTTGPLTYNPSTGVLTSAVMKSTSIPADLTTVVYQNAGNSAWYGISDKGVNKLGPSISLTTGVWQIYFQSISAVNTATATTVSSMQMWLSTNSNPSGQTISYPSLAGLAWSGSYTTPAVDGSRVQLLPVQTYLLNVTTATTYYMIVNMNWNTAITMYGGQVLYAIRVQ